MKVHIEQAGEHGVIYDVAPRLLPPNAWSQGRNVSTYAGNITAVRGYKSTIKTPDNAPYWLLPWQQETTQWWIYAGENASGVMELGKISDLNTETDVSRASTAYTATKTDRWSGGVLGGLPVCTNGVDEPQVWNEGAGKFVDMSTITGWDTDDTCKILIPHRSFLIAADCTESGTRRRSILRWSHPADPGSLPSTWDEDDATKLAGRVELSQTDDPIVDIMRLGEELYVYKTRSVWRMTFMDSSLVVWDFAPVFDSFGAASLHCVADTGDGHHIVFTGTDVKIHDGRTAKSLLSNRAKRRLPRTISPEAKDRSMVVVDRMFDEAWCCFPGQPSAQSTPIWPDKAFVVNWETGDTGWRELPPVSAGASGDLEDYESDETWNSHAPLLTLWDTRYRLWDDVFRQGRTNLILCAPAASRFYGANLAYTLDGEEYTAYLERKDIPLKGFDVDEVKTILNVYPKMTVGADYTVDVYIGTRFTEEGPITWHGPKVFDPDTDRKVDIRATGIWISIRFRFRGKAPFSMSGYALEVERSGWR